MHPVALGGVEAVFAASALEVGGALAASARPTRDGRWRRSQKQSSPVEKDSMWTVRAARRSNHTVTVHLRSVHPVGSFH